MTDIILDRDGVREIEDVEAALKTALGDDYLGMSLNPREAIIHLKDTATATKRALAKTTFSAAVAAIDPKIPPPMAARLARQEAAVTALRAADFAARQAAIANAASVPALRAEVAELAKMMQRLLIAQGLNEQDEA